jgi:hypothetical protein
MDLARLSIVVMLVSAIPGSQAIAGKVAVGSSETNKKVYQEKHYEG